jgi:hypothetical protein
VPAPLPSRQLSLFPPAGEELRQELLRIDPERLTPFDALDLLRRLIEQARYEGIYYLPPCPQPIAV